MKSKIIPNCLYKSKIKDYQIKDILRFFYLEQTKNIKPAYTCRHTKPILFESYITDHEKFECKYYSAQICTVTYNSTLTSFCLIEIL